MRQLGLSPNAGRARLRTAAATLALALGFGCKAAPEPSPAEASSPLPTANEPPPPAPSPAASAPASVPSATPPASSERTYAEGTKSITAQVGERFAVALPANVTIPMKWRLEPAPDAKLLTLVEEKYFDEPPKGCDGCTGYGGTRVFSFETKGAGKSTLHFALRPLTDPNGKVQKAVSIEITTAP